MKPVDQTKLLEEEGIGDCCRAVVASLLGMSMNNVPRFEDFTSCQHVAVVSFIESMGYQYTGCVVLDGTNNDILEEHGPGIDGCHYATGKSPRADEVRHAVVIDTSGRIVHDPHPSRAGLHYPVDVLVFKPLNGAMPCLGKRNVMSKHSSSRENCLESQSPAPQDALIM